MVRLNATPGPFQKEQLGGVVLWAHRGGGFEYPSNTPAAFAAFPDCALETDVRRTKDFRAGDPSTYADGLIAFHDANLEGTTNGTGVVRDRTYAELERLDPAHYWTPGAIADRDATTFPLRGQSATDPRLRISRLVDVLAMVKGRRLSMDLKDDGMEQAVGDLVKQTETLDTVVVNSFSDRRLARFARLHPQIRRGLGQNAIVRTLLLPRLRPASSSPVVFMAPPWRWGGLRLNRTMVRRAHALGIGVHVWTVNDADEATRLLDLGVDGLMTDCPSLLAPVVEGYNRDYA